jgi:hypothetical protein
MGVDEIINNEILRNLRGSEIEVTEEKVVRLSSKGEHIALIYTNSKYIDFSEEYQDPINHNHRLADLVNVLTKRGYKTNLK